MKDTRIRDILGMAAEGQEITAEGWVRTVRTSKNLCFVELGDGSCMRSLQCTVDTNDGTLGEPVKALTTGSSARITGTLVPSLGGKQTTELAVSGIELIGWASPDEYPLQKKRHSFEFLREIAHLRPRTNTFGAVTRVRNELSFAVHSFFQERGFLYIHTPIISASDAEGAGQMFQVTTLDIDGLRGSKEPVDYGRDFFGKKASLTVSGQLEAEIYALAFKNVYTFGPTFRAENSNTTRHLAEFWMIEPEMAFCALECDMELATAFIKHLITRVLERCSEDMAFFDQWIEKGIIESLSRVAASEFRHMTYTEAVEHLQSSGTAFEFPPEWGSDLQSEHERYLTETVCGGPVIVTDYPRDIKAFYMKQNDDGKTVRAMDILVPRLGEIIGGSEREADVERLGTRMEELGLERGDYWWYLDLRRYGSVPHSGFGLGFERLIQYVTGMQNIRDVIPFPRAVRDAEF